MPIATPREFFIHELSDAYSAEQQIVKLLPTLVKEADHKELADALTEHERETREQIKNLDQVFKLLGERPEAMVCHGAEGLKKEHDSFIKEEPSPEVLRLFVAGAAAKTEHYEIESYSGLVDMATLLGEDECAKLLEENLKQEEAMAKKAERYEKQLGKALVSADGAGSGKAKPAAKR
jgi:ferritin-like metal-binding protein YciE